MNIVEDYIKNKKTNISKIDKLFKRVPKFYFAHDFQALGNSIEIGEEVILRTSALLKFLAIPFIAFGVYIGIKFLPIMVSNILISLVLLIPLSAWIGLIVWASFLNPNYNYKIILDKEKIQIGKTILPWNRIMEIAIMEYGEGRNKVEQLIIFKNDQTILEFSLQNFEIYKAYILSYCEKYRKVDVAT